jgi:hypothetical protein
LQESSRTVVFGAGFIPLEFRCHPLELFVRVRVEAKRLDHIIWRFARDRLIGGKKARSWRRGRPKGAPRAPPAPSRSVVCRSPQGFVLMVRRTDTGEWHLPLGGSIRASLATSGLRAFLYEGLRPPILNANLAGERLFSLSRIGKHSSG